MWVTGTRIKLITAIVASAIFGRLCSGPCKPLAAHGDSYDTCFLSLCYCFLLQLGSWAGRDKAFCSAHLPPGQHRQVDLVSDGGLGRLSRPQTPCSTKRLPPHFETTEPIWKALKRLDTPSPGKLCVDGSNQIHPRKMAPHGRL